MITILTLAVILETAAILIFCKLFTKTYREVMTHYTDLVLDISKQNKELKRKLETLLAVCDQQAKPSNKTSRNSK